MTDILDKLTADETVQRMARDLRRTAVEKSELADPNGTPHLHYALEAANEYYEERGGELDAPKGTIAAAILAVAFEGR